MFSVLKEVKSFLHLEKISTDNIVFKLHYKVRESTYYIV